MKPSTRRAALLPFVDRCLVAAAIDGAARRSRRRRSSVKRIAYSFQKFYHRGRRFHRRAG